MRTFLFGLLILFSSLGKAQLISGSVSYAYIFSPESDKIIQTYNFSRPFLSEKQPLFQHGLNASLAYLFSSEKKFRHGLQIGYSFFTSYAENENLNNRLNQHFINPGYILHYEKAESNWYSELQVSARAGILLRRINGEPFIYDDSRSKAFGIGGEIGLKAGYYFNLKNKFTLSPFIFAGYTPYFYAPNTEAVINQTKGLTDKRQGIFTAQAGVSFYIRKS